MARLRHPEYGCSWDLRQDFATLVPYTLEEAYEVAEAVEHDDSKQLREELGDLLLQVVFYSQIAHERALFNFEEVAETIGRKLIRRHPHIFGETVFQTDEEQHAFWEASKRAERLEKSGLPKEESILDGISHRFPALMTAQKLQQRAAQHGFDWNCLDDVFAKMREELKELEDACATGNISDIHEELGDVLFVVANIAQRLSVDAETALRGTNRKFTRRFQYMEEQITAQGKSLNEYSLAEYDLLWEEAKRIERSST